MLGWRRILLGVLSGLAVVILCIGLVFHWPQIVVNPLSLRLAAQLLKKSEGIEIEWREAQTQFQSQGFLKKRLNLKVSSLCVSTTRSTLQWRSCVPEVYWSFSFGFSRFKLKWFDLAPLVLNHVKWTLVERQFRSRGMVNLSGEVLRHKEFPAQELGREGQWLFRLEAQVQFDSLTPRAAIAPGVSARGLGLSRVLSHPQVCVKAQVKVDPRSVTGIKVFYKIRARLDSKIGSSLQGMDPLFRLFSKAHPLKGVRTQQLIRGKRPWLVMMQGVIDPQQISGQIQSDIVIFPELRPMICKFRFERVVLDRSGSSRSSGRFHLDCPLKINLRRFSGFGLDSIPLDLSAQILVDLEFSHFIPKLMTEVSGDLELVVQPFGSAWLEGQARFNLHVVRGILSELPRYWAVRSSVQAQVELPDFQKVVTLLKHGSWAIPAPFHVLRGRIRWSTQGGCERLSSLEGQQPCALGSWVPFSLKTDLHSSTQIVKMSGEGGYSRERPGGISLDLMLNQLQLELPRLNWSKPPRIFPDLRIDHASPDESARSKKRFRYNIRIRTPVGHPALVISNLATRKVPVFLELRLTDSNPFSGVLRLASFSVNFFHRQAQIDSFYIVLKKPLSSSEIFGAFETTYADYKILIRLSDTFDHPQVHLQSEPPLPENQLFSVLLFGRPLDELSSTETASVGSARAALADQALGLVSLYALASTPIESLAYDPMTGMMSAKLKLAEGTSLHLGSNVKESTTVGVQSRLGKNWTLEADVGTTETSRGVASAYLQWSNRY
jgi:hypothetical protein